MEKIKRPTKTHPPIIHALRVLQSHVPLELWTCGGIFWPILPQQIQVLYLTITNFLNSVLISRLVYNIVNEEIWRYNIESPIV